MIRDLTAEFLPEEGLKYPVRVFHGKVQASDSIQEGSVIFILEPHKFSQSELKLLFEHKACFICFKPDPGTGFNASQHPIRLLLNHKDANRHLERIIGLKRNIMELYTEKNRKWDILGITASYKQLFTVNEFGFCFTEYPVILKDTLNLDDIFVQEAAKSSKPMDILDKYLRMIESNTASKLDAVNRRNALQKVFTFYKCPGAEYRFDFEKENISFLVDVLRLEELKDDLMRKAVTISALAAACAYFIHEGHPEAYYAVIEKLVEPEAAGSENMAKYKHISQEELMRLKEKDSFLYYHLSCRIPNQCCIALFDMFLVETEPGIKKKYEARMDSLAVYLERKITELSLMPENFLWEFKRDQEIGAMAGTVGQIYMYKHGRMDGIPQAFDEAEKYFKKAIEYAHPSEKARDINYLIQDKLSRLVQAAPFETGAGSPENELHSMAELLGKHFYGNQRYNAFDVMFSAAVIALASITLPEHTVEKLNKTMGLDWKRAIEIVDETSYLYASNLLAGYILFAPKHLMESSVDVDSLRKKAVRYFKLEDEKYQPGDILDIVGVKFILAHGWYLSKYGGEEEKKQIGSYKKRVMDLLDKLSYRQEYLDYLQECEKGCAPALKALKLMYTIPY